VRFAAEDENSSLEIPSPESVTYVEYDNPFAFVGECCGTTPVVQQLSPLAWVSVGGGVYVLECVGAGFIRVEPLKDPEGEIPHNFSTIAQINLETQSQKPSSKCIISRLRGIGSQPGRSISHHTCDPVTFCERKALNRLSEGLTPTSSAA